jgi:hypothetical protein
MGAHLDPDLPTQTPTPENEACRRIRFQLQHFRAASIRVEQKSFGLNVRAAKHDCARLDRPIPPKAGKHGRAPLVMSINGRTLQLHPDLA